MSQSPPPSSDEIAAAFEILRKSNKYLVIPKEHFHTRLSLALSNAYVQRHVEAHIYTVYDLILSHACASIDPIYHPRATIVPNPQAVFGPIAEFNSRAKLLALNIDSTSTPKSPNAPEPRTPAAEPQTPTIELQTPTVEPQTPNASGGHGGRSRDGIHVPSHHAGREMPVQSSDSDAREIDELRVPIQSEQDLRTPRIIRHQAHPQTTSHRRSVEPSSGTSTPAGKDRLRDVRIPDFARIILLAPDTSGTISQTEERNIRVMESRSLVDFWEIKRLGTPEYVSWFSAEGVLWVANDLDNNILQVYETAMAAFKHRPDLSEVTALLIIGVYFSMLVWERPDATVLSSLPPASVDPGQGGSTSFSVSESSIPQLHPTQHSSPSTPIQPPSTPRRAPAELFSQAIEKQKAIQEEILRRPLPKVFYWEEPVFYVDGDSENVSQARYSLSSAFLNALAMPLLSIKVTYQPSWFECKVNQDAMSRPEDVEGKERVATVLHKLEAHSEAENAMMGDLNFYVEHEDGSLSIEKRDPVGKTPPTDNHMDSTYKPPRLPKQSEPVSPTPVRRSNRPLVVPTRVPETLAVRDKRLGLTRREEEAVPEGDNFYIMS